MAITTLETVKEVIQTNATDARIVALIDLVEDYIKGYCNNDYTNSLGVTTYPLGYELIAIKMIEYNLINKPGVASESLSRHSISFTEDYPPMLTKGLKRRLSW